MRTPDPVIPAAERLFRGLHAGWIDGNAVLLVAVDAKGTSVNRERYSTPEDLIAKGYPRVGVLVAGDLPAPIIKNSQEWRFFAHDCPNPPADPTNDAHAEVRMRRPKDGANPTARWPGSDQARDELREALARKITLL